MRSHHWVMACLYYFSLLTYLHIYLVFISVRLLLPLNIITFSHPASFQMWLIHIKYELVSLMRNSFQWRQTDACSLEYLACTKVTLKSAFIMPLQPHASLSINYFLLPITNRISFPQSLLYFIRTTKKSSKGSNIFWQAASLYISGHIDSKRKHLIKFFDRYVFILPHNCSCLRFLQSQISDANG